METTKNTEPRRSRNAANAILEAAEELLAERGYDGVSMRDIAMQAGYTKALIFYYFRSKEELLTAVLDRYFKGYAETVRTAFASAEGTQRERIHFMMNAYFNYIFENRLYPRLVQHELVRGDGLGTMKQHFVMLGEAVMSALGNLTPSHGALAGRQFFVSIFSLIINYFTYAPVLAELWGEDPLSAAAREERRQHVLWVVDAMLDGLAARRPSA